MPELQANPTNTDLLLSVARVYQADHMDEKATEIYQYVLRKSPRDKQALTGIVNWRWRVVITTMPAKHSRRWNPAGDADYMLLAARVAAANGENQRAMSLLRTAQWRLQQGGDDDSDELSSVMSLPSPTRRGRNKPP